MLALGFGTEQFIKKFIIVITYFLSPPITCKHSHRTEPEGAHTEGAQTWARSWSHGQEGTAGQEGERATGGVWSLSAGRGAGGWMRESCPELWLLPSAWGKQLWSRPGEGLGVCAAAGAGVPGLWGGDGGGLTQRGPGDTAGLCAARGGSAAFPRLRWRFLRARELREFSDWDRCSTRASS